MGLCRGGGRGMSGRSFKAKFLTVESGTFVIFTYSDLFLLLIQLLTIF